MVDVQALAALFLALLCSGLLILLHRFVSVKIPSRVRYAVLFLITAIPAAQLLIISAGQVIRRDDYWEIADARSYGFPASILFELKNHDGRYFSWFLKSLYAFFDTLLYARILLVLNILILTYACCLTADSLLKFQSRPGNGIRQRLFTFMAGFSYAVMIILLASNTWEVWFWPAGTCIYGLSVSLCILAFTLVWRSTQEPENTGKGARIAAVLICFTACGCSELGTASLAAFLLILLIWKRFTEKRWHKWLVFHFAEVMICACTNLLLTKSIDAAQRYVENGANYTNGVRQGLFSMIKTAADSLWRYSVIDHRPLILFLFLFFLMGMLTRFPHGTIKKFCAAALLLILTAHAVLFITVLLEYTPARVVSIPMCWTYAAAALICLSAGSLVSEKLSGQTDPALMALCALLLIFCVNDFYSENIDRIRMIRSGWIQRDTELEDSFGSSGVLHTCSLPTLGSSHDDISEDPEDLFNKAFRMYYHVPAVIADRRCPPFDGEE